MKRMVICASILILISSNLFAKNDELRNYLKQNINKYVEVYVKSNAKGTPNSGILRQVLNDILIIQLDTWTYVVNIDSISYIVLIPK